MGRTYLRPVTGTSEGPTKERFQRAPVGARIERCPSFEISEVSLRTAAEATRNWFWLNWFSGRFFDERGECARKIYQRQSARII
jgi:hypothetical protein